MAVNKKDIVELVLSLSSSEKRYFKANHPKDSDYIRLFDIINDNRRYDEDKVKEHFKSKHLSSYSSVVRTYLKEKLLESLRSYHIKTDIRLELSSLIDNSRILYLKGLYHHQWKEINKAKALAKKYDLYEEQLIINEIEQYYWNLIYHFDTNVEEVDNPFLEGVAIANQLNKINTSKLRSKTHQLNEHNISPVETTIYEQVYTFLWKAQEELDKKNFSEAINIYDQCIKLWLANPTKISAHPILVIRSYISYAYCLSAVEKHGAAIDKLSNIKSFALQLTKDKSSNNELQFEHFLQLFITEISIYNKQEQYESIINIIDEIKDLEKTFPHTYMTNVSVPISYRQILYYNFAHAFFKLNRFEEAQSWIEQFQDFSLQELKNCISSVTLLELMIYFECKFDNLPSYIKSGQKSLHKLGQLGELEEAVIRMFGKLVGKRYENKPHLVFTKFADDIEALVYKRTIKYFPLDIMSWINQHSIDTKILQ